MNAQEKARHLEDLEDKVLAAYVANTIKRGGEDFAPMYRKYPKLFKILVKNEMAADRKLRIYLRDLAKHAIEEMDWNEYERKVSSWKKASATPGAVFKADVLDYLVKDFWEGETLVLKVLLTGALMDALEAGGLYTIEDLQVEVPWSRNEPPVIEFMNKYSLSLSGQLTRVTQDRVYSALKESIANGEPRSGAEKRINQVINDPKRASAIAQTESVRAFTAGRMKVGEEIGADRKSWRTAGAKDFCKTFEGYGIVPWKFKYLTPRGAKLYETPGHPYCRCGMQIYMPDEKV